MTTNESVTINICNAKDYLFVKNDNIAVWDISIKKHRQYNRLDECLQLGVMEVTKIYQCLHGMGLINAIYFFLRTPSVFLPNVIMRRNGIWRHRDFLWISSHKKTKTIVETDDNGIYYCGIVELDNFDLFKALNHSRNSLSSALLLAPNLNTESLLSSFQFKKIFNEKTGHINWGEFINIFCVDANIVLKVHGTFDDEEVSVDLFMDKKLSYTLREAMQR
jgi:hypothetical protein